MTTSVMSIVAVIENFISKKHIHPFKEEKRKEKRGNTEREKA